MLTELNCRNAKPKTLAYKLGDGHGLYLLVMPNGSKYWRLKFAYAIATERAERNPAAEIKSLMRPYIRYGSSDRKVICMLKNGLSIELAKCLLNGAYDAFLSFDLEKNNIKIDREVILLMQQKEENNLLVFEAQFHVSEGLPTDAIH